MNYIPKAVTGLLALAACGALLAPAFGQDLAAPNFPDRSLASFLTMADNAMQGEESAATPEFPELVVPDESPPGEAEVSPQETEAPPTDEEAESPGEPEPQLTFRAIEERTETARLSEVNEILNMTMGVIDFRDADLMDVLRGIALKSRLNIIMSPQVVTGRVSLHLENVRLSVVLENILRINDLAYVILPDENLIRIVPASAVGIRKVETTTEIIPINWVNAQDLAQTLKAFVSEDGSIVASAETNSLIVTDTPPSLATIRGLVDKIDIPERQVQVEARLVDMSDAALRSLGINSSMWQADGSGNSPESLSKTFQTIIPGTAGSPAVVDPFGNIITPAVEATEATVLSHTETTPVDMMQTVFPIAASAGLDWAFGDVVTIFGSSYNLASRIQALESRDLVEVLSNPKVVTLNNLTASIKIIRKIPYTEAVTGVSGVTTIEVEFEDAGVEITVLPIITPNGFVRMNLTTDQMIFRGRVGQGELDPPLIDTRNANTNVIVRTGETVMLGGLREMRLADSTSGVPWFHQIPIVGWLFKSKAHDQSKTELYLFVTPTIIEKVELTSDEKGWYDRIDAKWHLPDYFFDDVRIKSDK